MAFKDGRILKSLSKEESPLLRWICYLDLIFFSLCYHFLPLQVTFCSFPVAQMVEHGASNAKIMGSIPRESKSW